MTGEAEMVAGAVVEHVAGKFSETTLERIGGMLWNFKDDVQDMKKQMGTLQVVLSYADNRSRGRGTTDDDALAQHWLKKYKSVAYDIEDAVDELEANATIWERSPSKVRFYDRVLTRVYKHFLHKKNEYISMASHRFISF